MGGPLPVLASWFGALRAAAAESGLTVNPAKCEVICGPGAAPDAWPLFPAIPLDRFPPVSAFSLLGAPCGDRAFAADWSEKYFAAASRKIRCFTALPSPHLAFALLRACGGFPLANLRAAGWSPHAVAFDKAMRDAVASTIGPLGDDHWAVVAAPPRDGGFGIRPCAPFASVAFAAATAYVRPRLASLFSDPAFVPTDFAMLPFVAATLAADPT